MWIISIPILAIIIFMVYQYVLLPKMNAKQDAKFNSLVEDFASQINGKEKEFKNQFIESNESIKKIASQINNNDIIGVISCQEKRETKDMIRQQAVNMAGKALGKITGVGVKEVDNTDYYYLILTLNTFNYIHYNEKGNCVECLSFDRDKMMNIEVGKITSSDALKNNAYVGESERLSFNYDDAQYKFFFYKECYPLPVDKNSRSEKDLAQLTYLFAKPFIEFTQQYR